ncbi:hypothetical protein THII_0368 [Thioploca ingrica]|uniref:Transmembrane protein n=1 Tax=Thioploca ingrica TaxID=40754 RepID=A0A090AIK6_9GAMM|nr:hypothetical protein THII_0368 [Thioploca ingrica]
MFTYLKFLYQPFYLKLLAVALVIFSARLWLIHNFGSSIPFWDQWDMQASGLFLPWLDGTLKWDDLFAAHNEHRVFVTRLLSLSLLILNEIQWNPLLEMIVNALLSTTIAIILIAVLKNKLEPTIQNWLLLSIILLWSLPYGWESILGGSHHFPYYLMILFSVISAWGLLLHDNFSWKWWLGAICALAAYFNLASGFFMSVVIIILKLYLIAIDKGNRRSHLPTLLIGALITMIAVMLLVKVPGHAVLKAHSVTDFLLTFGKSLAWPWVTYPWLSLILYLPFLALVLRIVWLRRYPSPAEIFVLALGGWVTLQAASMGYARGAGGSSPTSRYMDILAFGVVVNLFAFYFITQPWYNLTCWIKPAFHVFACFWQVLVVIGLGGLTVVGSWPAIQQKQFQGMEQLKNTREFIRTGQISALQKPFLHIPYPDPNRLAYLLANPKLRRILPHTLTVPSLLQSEQQNSSFIADGFYPTTGKYQNEITLGSYNSLGDHAIGRFESTSLQYQHSFLEIPVAGYLGEKDLTLQLVVEGQANPIIVTPPRLAKESWISCYVRTPNRPFKLVAIDNNPNSWFAFAMPRSLGWLSFISIQILEQARTLLILSLFLLGMIFCLPISITQLSRD